MTGRTVGGRRSWWWGRGLLDLCAHELAGHDTCDDRADADPAGNGPGTGQRKTAKPLVLVHVDLEHTTVTDAGNVELGVPGGGLPAITRRRLEEILSTDHDLRIVLFDDGRPLATSDLIHADDIPTKTRIAVRARDRGCRFDGRTPAARAHQHHIDGRANGHHPDRIITVGPWAHLRAIHRHGWHPELQHHGIIRWRRGTSTFRTLPWGTPLRRMAPDDDPNGDYGGG
ncbi:MAG: hypothetical protein KY437_06995 [Actinobacteria bacterium]|nr:hypothetical protein [Actinomycetota bacterium]